MTNAELQILLKLRDEASQELDKAAETVRDYSAELKIAGAAMTAVGAGGLKVVSDAKKMNAQLSQAAITSGTTTEEMRGLALEITNVTFPLESVTATFNLLVRAGVTNTDVLEQSANAFDALADATGSSAHEVAELLLPAFKLFGEEIPTTSAELDKFTWLTKHTLVDLSDFGTLLTRMAPYMDQLDMSMDDAIATLAALGEQGIVGTAATLKLRTAITQAASGAMDLNEALGLSQEEIDGFKAQITGATGITDQYAAALNTQFSLVDKLKQKFSEFSLGVGSLVEPLEGVFGAMTALGPAMLFMSTQQGVGAAKAAAHTTALVAHKGALLVHTAVTGGATAATTAFGVAMSVATGPIGLIIAAIGLLVAAGVLLWKNWDKVKEYAGKIWGGIKDIVSGAVNGMIGMVNSLIGAFEKALNFVGDGLRKIPSFTIPSWVPLIGGKEFKVPAPPHITLPRIPTMDTGGLVEGPGLFHVGAGVKEIVRYGQQGNSISVTINANTREGGEAAARGFMEEMHRRGLRLSGVYS